MRFRCALFSALAVLALIYPVSVGAVEDITPRSLAYDSTLSIDGPLSPINPGQDVWLKISGLTLEEIKAAKKAGQFDLTVFPLEGVRIHATYDWLNDQLELLFTATKPGTYIVKMQLIEGNNDETKAELAAIQSTIASIKEGDSIDKKLLERIAALKINEPTQAIASCVIQVGDGPDPPKPPDPPDPPEPNNEKKQVVLFAETSSVPSLSQEQQSLLTSLTLRDELKAQGHVLLGGYDPDARNKSNTVPQDRVAWFKAVEGKTLPVVAVAPKSGGPIVVHPLPATEAEFWKLLGGKQ